ncbi:DegT/DnrJ/EryC1/StrS family aminotransferase [bacterium]|nr:DegT/DnrJ/EryC1/StrS family aminotransferase [bacterium]
MIAQAKPLLGPEEEAVALGVIQRGELAVGPELVALEGALGELLKLPPAVNTSCGFAAIHLALLALPLAPGAEVILPCISTCAALRDAVIAARGIPVFADVERETPNLDPQSVAEHLTPRTAAILCPHHLGIPARMNELLALGPPVIEDCAQSLGASTEQGQPLGSLGKAAVFSYYPTKLISAPDGGAVVSSDPQLLERARNLRYYGGMNDDTARLNYKLTNLNAAIALVQLGKLPGFLARRRSIWQRLRDAVGAQVLPFPPGAACFRFGFWSSPEGAPRVLRQMQARSMPCRNEFYFLCSPEGFPSAQRWQQQFLTIPTYPALLDSQVDEIVQQIREVLAL